MLSPRLIAIMGATLFGVNISSFECVAQTNVGSASQNYGSYSGQNDSPGTLHCNLSAITPLAGNHIGGFNSNGYNFIIGVDANFGSIGSELELINGNSQINVLESRSGAGAGWQTSYYLYDQPSDQFIVFNQGAGNSIGYQWGYGTSVTNLTTEDWTPLFSDAVTHNWSTSNPNTTASSPCANTGYQFDTGRGAFVANPIETNDGVVGHVVNYFDIKADQDQYWTFEDIEQALYLSKQVAINNNLRIFLVGKSGWTEGPISPVGNFTVKNKDYGSCDGNGHCSYGIKQDISYMLLVWNVGGEDIGMAITNLGLGAQINDSANTYCSDQTNPSCGSIDIHNWLSVSNNISIQAKEIRDFRNEYYIGSLNQLRDLGFSAGGGAFGGPYQVGQGTTCAATTAAATNNALATNPVSNLVSRNGFYSSNSFSSNSNTNQTYVTVESGPSSGHVQFNARQIKNSNYGFPSEYHLEALQTNSNSYVDMGLFNAQPNTNGMVDIPLGYKLNTSAFLLYPQELGQDNYGGYYLQMSGFSGCN